MVSNGFDDESAQRIFIDSHTKAEAKRTQAALMQAVSFYTSSCKVIPKREVKSTEKSSRSKVCPWNAIKIVIAVNSVQIVVMTILGTPVLARAKR